MSGRVFFYVQHLLGIGHLRRAEALTTAMSEEGLDVTVALGSRRLPEVPFASAQVVQLPPARIRGENFSQLIDEHGADVTDAWKAKRRDLLIAACRDAEPDVALFELFPFGRRQFRFELLPLLEALHASVRRPVIASSVRDILVAAGKPGRDEETAALVRRYFDLVLVHGDETVIPFGATFAPTPTIQERIRYTGYVTTPPGAPAKEGHGEVLVSAGGGATGSALFHAALDARPATAVSGHTWRLLTGPDLPDEDFEALRRRADDRTVVERFRRDLPARLRVCALSISRAGYNTTMDILQSGARAVVVPYENAQETEQRMRAELLAAKGLLTVVPEAELSPQRLAAGIEAALAIPPPSPGTIRLDGARETARIVQEFASTRRSVAIADR